MTMLAVVCFVALLVALAVWLYRIERRARRLAEDLAVLRRHVDKLEAHHNTGALQAALDAAAKQGGGTVTIPFLVGTPDGKYRTTLKKNT